MSRLCRAAFAMMVLTAGCYSNDSALQAPPPGLPPRDHVAAAPTPTEPAPARRQWAPVPRHTPTVSPPVTTASGTTGAPADEADTPVATAPKRDLAEELRTLVGDPSACFAQRTAGTGPSTLTFSVNATVTPSGMITRASVTGAGVTPQESDCLAGLVTRGQFRSPVEGAPRAVTTSVELRETPKPAKAPAAAPSAP